MTQDDKRNGTTSLYAALEIATGEVTGVCSTPTKVPRVLQPARARLPAPTAARRP
jgi:hypothetical protein